MSWVSFDPVTRWSTSTPTHAAGAWAEFGEPRRQVVQSLEMLDHHALDPQIVAPHPFDQRRVVHAFDPDPARRSHPGTQSFDPGGARGGAGLALGRGGSGPHQRHRLPVDQERGLTHGEQAHRATGVLEFDELAVVAAIESDDGAAESTRRVLHHEVTFGVHPRNRAFAGAGVAGKDVTAVHVTRTHLPEATAPETVRRCGAPGLRGGGSHNACVPGPCGRTRDDLAL